MQAPRHLGNASKMECQGLSPKC